MKKIIILGIVLCPDFAYGVIADSGLSNNCAILECADGYTANLITCQCEKDGELGGLDCSNMGDCMECTAWAEDMNVDGLDYRTCYTRNATTCLCEPNIIYRCRAGYYGQPTLSDLTCTLCPDGGTSFPGFSIGDDLSNWDSSIITNVSISGCYLPADTTGTDETGEYTFTEACYYITDE